MNRRSHQCHHDGCDSAAEWQMWVKFTSRTPAGVFVAIDGKSSIAVCDRHRRDAAESFFGERNMDSFADDLEREGLACPHPNAIRIEFSPYLHPHEVN